jgi:hypothetical protein
MYWVALSSSSMCLHGYRTIPRHNRPFASLHRIFLLILIPMGFKVDFKLLESLVQLICINLPPIRFNFELGIHFEGLECSCSPHLLCVDFNLSSWLDLVEILHFLLQVGEFFGTYTCQP